MDATELDKLRQQYESIPQINKENILGDDVVISRNILDFDDDVIKVKITDQNFDEMQDVVSLIKNTMKESLETTSLYENIPNICFNSFIMEYNEDESKFTSKKATVIEDDNAALNDQITLIQTVLNNIIENVFIKSDANEQRTKKINASLQVEELFPLNNWKVRRTSSLRQLNSTDDATCTTTKKIVRFADSLGLDLIDVRTYMDEMPKIPLSAFQDLTRANCTKDTYRSKLDWRAVFEQPESLPNFKKRLSRNFVCMQSTEIKNNCLKGTVMVENIAYEKLVQLRFTRNNWKTYFDCDCSFLESDCGVDRFQFDIDVGEVILHVDSKIEFALRFRCRDHEFWDNNFGNNYIFECVSIASKAIENGSENIDTCSDACNSNNSEELGDTLLTRTLVQDYMSKLLLQNESSDQKTYQKQIRNSERTLEVFVITGMLIMCAIFLYIEKVIYFV